MRNLSLVIAVVAIGCGNEPGTRSPDAGLGAPPEVAPFTSGEPPMVFSVPAKGRVHVSLGSRSVVEGGAIWDLAFEGWDVLTNGGASGTGLGAAFGPDDVLACASDELNAPILRKDATGGAFRGWYAYDNTAHALYSKFHVYGVRDGSRTWKVQVLSYYGEVVGAPTSAVYRIRWAEVTAGGSGPVQHVSGIDGTAGGAAATPDSKSECLDLGTGARTLLSPSEARSSTAWHLCFRRDAISVNGELGGPRGVSAVDLDAAAATPTIDALSKMTPEGERTRFDAVDATKLSSPSLRYRGDRIVSAFSDAWFASADPREPKAACWVVVGPDGRTRYGVVFEAFTGATSASPGTISLHVRRDRAP